ncbi:MAG: glycosyltransferase family 39 protein [Bryobacteraceae bacterium]
MVSFLSRIPRAWWLAGPLLLLLYLYGLTGAGLLGPDEPRYAAIGREMAQSGDWITPRLWGDPWFEKPALLYWMTAAGFRLGLGEELAPRLPVALLSVAFLVFFQRKLRSEFGDAASWSATVILGTSPAWLGYSFIGAPDLPMTAAFAAAMLLSMEWFTAGNTRSLPWLAALMGIAVLAKGLVPLVLALPLLWFARRRWMDLVRPRVVVPFLIVALPWYLLCYARNGMPFIRSFFLEHHFARFTENTLMHQQPFWFYAPVLLGALLPWTPLIAFAARRGLYADMRMRFVLVWAAFGFLFFSAAKNKLPGYLLPLIPAVAILMGCGIVRAKGARWALPVVGLCLISVPVAIEIMPRALATGISRAALPSPHWTWLLPVALALGIFGLERRGGRPAALALTGFSVAACFLALKAVDLPAVDEAASVRSFWQSIAAQRGSVCVATMHRSWRYGLNYYSNNPLPDCTVALRPLQIRQQPGYPPQIVDAARPGDAARP